jgi:hypothetical protein
VESLRNPELVSERMQVLEQGTVTPEAIGMYRLPDGTEVLALGPGAVGVALPSGRVLWVEGAQVGGRPPLEVAAEVVATADDVAPPTSRVPFTVAHLRAPLSRQGATV